MNTAAHDVVPATDTIETIAFVGDSQPRAFEGTLFNDLARPGTAIMPLVRRTQYFRAHQFFDGTRFDEWMTHVLWEMKCVLQAKDDGDPIFTPFVYSIFADIMGQRALRRNPAAPPIVISCGGVDLFDIEHELFPQYTFDPDPWPSALDTLPPYEASEHLSQERVLAIIEERCAPIFSGIRALRATGFENIFLFGRSAPIMEHRDEWKPLRWRYLMRYAMNLVYERLAPAAGATYVDIWNPLNTNGVRDARYFADAEHMNAQGAAIILRQIYSHLRR